MCTNYLLLDTDLTGHPTVGYGHLCQDAKCSSVPYPIPLSKSDGEKLLASDISVSDIYPSCRSILVLS